MSVGISDRFVQRSMQGRIIVIVCETGIDAELHDTQLIGRQFVHRGEDLLHGTHIEDYRINGREAICRSYARRGERLYNTARMHHNLLAKGFGVSGAVYDERADCRDRAWKARTTSTAE